MSRALIILSSDNAREKAIKWVRGVPPMTRLEFKEPKRTIPQNEIMWAMLSEISIQLDWHGVKLSTDDWKLVFMDALNREIRLVPNIDGTGFVNVGTSTSDLSKSEMADLITLMIAFGDKHGVIFNDKSSIPANGRAA